MNENIRVRADAQRNHEKILVVASQVFAEQGLGAPLDEIATRAGVGSGTLYRHFPTRQHLITAVHQDLVTDVLRRLDVALGANDPWSGFSYWVLDTSRTLAANRGLADILVLGQQHTEIDELGKRAYQGMSDLIKRAVTANSLRADFSVEDLVLLFMAIAGISRRAGNAAPTAVERFVTLSLDGYHAAAATPAPPPVRIFSHFT
jgi:AcrR family transcriptional regulator